MINKLFYCSCYQVVDLLYGSVAIYLQSNQEMFCPGSLPTYLLEIVLCFQVMLDVDDPTLEVSNLLRNTWLVFYFT